MRHICIIGVRSISGMGLLAAAGWLAGCGPTEQERFGDLIKQNKELKMEKTGLEELLQSRDARIVRLQGQMQNLRDQGLAQPEPLFAIDHIEILDITGGVDTDDQLGDDAVAVYFRPIDRDGDVVKRAGQIKIKLLDNSTAVAPKLLGHRVDNSPEQLRASWYGKFWTNHYKIEVPFYSGTKLRPGQEVDVHVSFLEFATGAEYTARKVVKIALPNPDVTNMP
ncbi:MAG: hypothetical protein V3W34_00175 [Phycisphaerae bacterium]